MIKAKKGHVTFRGLPSEVFEDLRHVCAAVRIWLTGATDMNESEVEVFIDNAVISSRSEAWNKALDESKSEEEVFEVLSEVNSTLKKALALLKAKDDERGCECCECKCEEEKNG